MAKSTFSSVLKRLFSIFSPHTCNSSVPIVWSELHGTNGAKAEKKGSNDEFMVDATVFLEASNGTDLYDFLDL